ncbi:TY-Chap2 family putative peptide chaperone (plasmid) [Coraliomargarita sp. W4R53]
MTLIAVHRARTAKGLPLEPVGIWIIDDTDAIPYYPPPHQQFEARGVKALHNRPTESVVDWVMYKASTSPNWKIHQCPSKLFEVEVVDAAKVYEDVQFQHDRELAAHHSASGSAPRRSKAAVAAITPASAWQANRFVVAQSWWIASELSRRHPELIVYEMHPGGGQYDVLCVATPDQLSPDPLEETPRVMINRVGTIQIHRGAESTPVADWPRVLRTQDPHQIVKTIEASAGLGSPTEKSSTTTRSIGYRFFAAALAMLVNDRYSWDVRSESQDTSDGMRRAHQIDGFPSVVEAIDQTPRLGIHGEPYSHYWVLRKDGQPVAVLSMEGWLHLADGTRRDLMSAYAKNGRNMISLTASILEDWS